MAMNKKNSFHGIKKNNYLIYIGGGCLGVVLVLVILLIINGFDFKSIMGNSVVETFYYCDDSTYTLEGNKCIKSDVSSALILGDVNLDGVVSDADLILLNSYLAKTSELNENQLIASDVNSDGIISVGDSENIRLFVNGHTTGSEYLVKIGSSYVCPKNYQLKENVCVSDISIDAKSASYKRGDVNLDGNIDLQDIELLSNYLNKKTNFSMVQLQVADYNVNGTIEINDLNDLKDFLNNKDNSSNPSLGDVNSDKIVNDTDVIIIKKYIEGKYKFNSDQIKNADINSDGVVDAFDVTELVDKVSSFYQNGDINLDGKVDIDDLAMLQNGLNGIVNVNDVQLKLCDINVDGKIDNEDAVTLRGKVGTAQKYKIGDVNMDGRVLNDDVSIIENYILGKTTLTIDQMTFADYNKDSNINNTDANALAKAIAANYKLGDVDMDGKITIVDVDLISKYVAKLIDFDTTQKILADVNKDGKINSKDIK